MRVGLGMTMMMGVMGRVIPTLSTLIRMICSGRRTRIRRGVGILNVLCGGVVLILIRRNETIVMRGGDRSLRGGISMLGDGGSICRMS